MDVSITEYKRYGIGTPDSFAIPIACISFYFPINHPKCCLIASATRFPVLFHSALAKQPCQFFEVLCLLKVRDLLFELVVVFRQWKRQLSEIPQQLAALAFVYAVVDIRYNRRNRGRRGCS